MSQEGFNWSKVFSLKLDGSLELKRYHIVSEMSKRMNMMLKVQESNLIGIVLVNPLIENATTILDDVIKILKLNNKKYFIFSLNSLNEFKLANFPNIDVFVQISCPWTSIRSYYEFYKVVITPFELIEAFDLDNWTGKINLDTKNWKVGEEKFVEASGCNDLEGNSVDCRAIVVKKENLQILSLKELEDTHEGYIHASFKGLDRKQNIKIGKAVTGKKGIAMQYD